MLGRQVQAGGAEIVVELLDRASAEDHRRDSRTVDQPGQSHLGHGRVVLAGHGADGVDDVPGALDAAAPVVGLDATVGILAEPGRAGGRLGARVLAGQPATAERRPRQQAEPGGLCGRNDLPLDLANQQVVLRLQGHRPGQPTEIGDVDGLLQLPARVVGQADVEHLAGAHGVVEEAKGFLQWRQRIEGVHLVEIDRVDTEASERRVERGGEVPARQAEVVGAVAHWETPFCGKDDLLACRAPLGQPAADDLLADSAAVHVGGVDQIAADFQVTVELCVRCVLVGLGAERHGAQRERRYDRAARAKIPVLHGGSPQGRVGPSPAPLAAIAAATSSRS